MTTKKPISKTPKQPLLQVETWRVGRIVYARIVHQDERLRRQGAGDRPIVCNDSNGLSVQSSACPALNLDTFWLRGYDRNSDHNTARITLDTETEAAAYLDRLNRAIEGVQLPKGAKAKAPTPKTTPARLVSSRATAESE